MTLIACNELCDIEIAMTMVCQESNTSYGYQSTGSATQTF